MDDLISRQDAIKVLTRKEREEFNDWERSGDERSLCAKKAYSSSIFVIYDLPSADAVEVVRCKDCKHWRRQTNYAGAQLSFGFCESDDMWRSLYGETYEVSHIDTDDDFYCGYAERRQDG